MPRKQNGTFAKGASGNPGGRPKAPIRLRELYDKDKGDDWIYARLREIAEQSDHLPAAIRAIEILLDRRYGRAPTLDDAGNAISDVGIKVVVPKLDDIALTPEPK